MFSVDYIGSKKKLIKYIDNELDKLSITKDSKVADVFAGTGVVSHHILTKYNANVISNDSMYYAYIINCGKLTKYTEKELEFINRKIDKYNKLKPLKSYVNEHFAPPNRMYFTNNNAMMIDAIRTQLEKDKSTFNIKIYNCLLASLLSACDKVSNTSVVYAAYLKDFKQSATKDLVLNKINSKDIVSKSAKIFNNDAFDLIKNKSFDVVYLDPPYNSRQYEDNYHVLNTIAKYDNFELHGKTGLPSILKKSVFSSKTQVYNGFKELITMIKSKYIVLSYNDEGLLSLKDLKTILEDKGVVKIKKIKYKKFKAQERVTRDFVTEYILTIKTK